MSARAPWAGLVLAWCVAGAATAGLPGGETGPRFQPTAELEPGQTWERLTVDSAAAHSVEDRWLWTARLGVGLSARLPAVGGLDHLRSETAVGLGLVFASGHWPVHVRTQLLWDQELGHQVSLVLGLSTGVLLDTGAPHRSAWEAGIPLGLRWRFLDLLYHPAVIVPLGAEESSVFGGLRRSSARPGLSPFGLLLRVRLAALGFGA